MCPQVARPCRADIAGIDKLKERYPSLVSVDFSRWEKLKNIDVKKMEAYKLCIEELQIGEVDRRYTKQSRILIEPQISNKVSYTTSVDPIIVKLQQLLEAALQHETES